MKVALATHGRFHSFDLARQLDARGLFSGIWTSYPAFKVADEGLPPGTVHSVALTTYLERILDRIPGLPLRVKQEVAWAGGERLDHAVRRGMERDVDALVALSGGGLSAGKALQARGGVYVCDRGSTHVRYQEEVLREEHALYGVPFVPFFPRMMDKEEAEYAAADAVLVPTHFAAQSFVARGIPESRLRIAPYGVDLGQFHPSGTPPEDSFEVLFVGALSIRKGIRYLLEAFDRFDHPKKRLTLVGQPLPETAPLVAKAVSGGEVVATGPVSRDEVRDRMSRSHVMVLPSVEEGLALVQAQALACGCPVIATPPTGSEELYRDGEEGFIVPARDPAAIADRLTRLADEPELRTRMSEAAVRRVQELGGWGRYGDLVVAHLEGLLKAKRRP